MNMFLEAITNSRFKGAYNATAPNPVTMGQMCNTLGNCLGRPSWLPVPGFALTVNQLLLALHASCVRPD